MATDIAFFLGVLSLSPETASRHLLVFSCLLSPQWTISERSWDRDLPHRRRHLHSTDVVCNPALGHLLMKRVGVRTPAAYIPVGVLCWSALLSSGVHATVADVGVFAASVLSGAVGFVLLRFARLAASLQTHRPHINQSKK
ncbi:MAG TPA: Na+/H+ antiporter NhaA [Terriglobales bacterium]|nr:Na+/H+ antiporter NhaA [Terriglobales bacterium]